MSKSIHFSEMTPLIFLKLIKNFTIVFQMALNLIFYPSIVDFGHNFSTAIVTASDGSAVGEYLILG